MDGDPELLDDSEFYHQLLKEFLDSCDPSSSGNIACNCKLLPIGFAIFRTVT